MLSAKENLLVIILGVVALSSGIFITKEECPPNEEYLLCGTACPFNCTNPRGPVSCTDDCVEGCFCKSGFLRNENSTCVSANTCIGTGNQVCGENEEFLSCGTACPMTCQQSETLTCNLACSMGCFCKSGFIRDTVSNKCVRLDQCPVEQCLNENEVYDICNGACEPSCEDPEPICTTICSGGCVCASGLLRNATGDCVSVDRCPPNNGTDPGLVGKYLDVISRILHMSNGSDGITNL